MRARWPDRAGYATNRGVRLFYEVHGSGPVTVLLVPPWAVTTAAFWKMQVPFLARHFRIILYDPRGNGRSDRPAEGYAIEEVTGDALAVLDEVGADRCALLTVSGGMPPCCFLAAYRPDRVAALAAVSGSPYNSLTKTQVFERERRRRFLLEQFDEWTRGFWARNLPEAHSTKAQDDGWEWTHETTPSIVLASAKGLYTFDAREAFDRIRCPVLLVHGMREDDHEESFVAYRGLPHSTLVTIITPGHLPNVRDPVRVNLFLREFLYGVAAAEATEAA